MKKISKKKTNNSIIFKRSNQIPDKRFKKGWRQGQKLIDIMNMPPEVKRPSGYIPREEYIKIFEYLQKMGSKPITQRFPDSSKPYYIAKGTGIPHERVLQILGWMRRQSLIDENNDDEAWRKRGHNKEYWYYIWDEGYRQEARVIYDMLKRGARILFRWLAFYEGDFIVPRTPILYKEGDKIEVQIKPQKGKGRKKKIDKLQMMGTIAESLGKDGKPTGKKVHSVYGVRTV